MDHDNDEALIAKLKELTAKLNVAIVEGLEKGLRITVDPGPQSTYEPATSRIIKLDISRPL